MALEKMVNDEEWVQVSTEPLLAGGAFNGYCVCHH
jgi:hypothetical protein